MLESEVLPRRLAQSGHTHLSEGRRTTQAPCADARRYGNCGKFAVKSPRQCRELHPKWLAAWPYLCSVYESRRVGKAIAVRRTCALLPVICCCHDIQLRETTTVRLSSRYTLPKARRVTAVLQKKPCSSSKDSWRVHIVIPRAFAVCARRCEETPSSFRP